MRKTSVLSLVALLVLFLPPISRAQATTAPMLRKIAVGFDPSIGRSVRQRVMDTNRAKRRAPACRATLRPTRDR